MSLFLDVSYKPKGTITYSGGTRYDGWTAMMLDRMPDGTLLDGNGKPLPPGQPPVYLHFEVYDKAEFNEIDFGEYQGEFEVEGIKRISYADVMSEMPKATKVSFGSAGDFAAPRRVRPLVKVIITHATTGKAIDGFGTQLFILNENTPHLQQAVTERLTEIVFGFIEGRYSLRSMSFDNAVYADLSDVLVDDTQSKVSDRFNCWQRFVPSDFLDDLAKLVLATFSVKVDIVDAPQSGLLFRRDQPST